MELYIIELYGGYRNQHLPANTTEGIAGQNPLLLEAFNKLAAADTRFNKSES